MSSRLAADTTCSKISSETGSLVAPSDPILRSTVDKLQALVESDPAAFASLIEYLPVGVCMGDMAGITICNSAALAVMGFDSITQLHQSIATLTEQLEIRSYGTGLPLLPNEWLFAQALAGEASVSRVAFSQLKSKREIVAECITVPITRNGQVISAMALVSDVTVTERAEAASKDRTRELEQQARLFDTVLSSIVDFAYTFNRQGRFTYINQALLDLWQMHLEDALGKNFFELNYPQELAARLHDQIETVFRTGVILRDETPYTGAAGTTGYYEYIFVPVFTDEGVVDVVAGSTRDITGRRLSPNRRRGRLLLHKW